MPRKPDATPSPRQPLTIRCAYCGQAFKLLSIAGHKTFPFCSARCREADLGNWFSGRYKVPGPPLPPEPPDESNEQ